MARVKKTITNEECYNMPFPQRLRGLLDDPNETQDKLAKGIGVNRQSIGQWKDGITSPDINALNKIADYYKVSTDYLLGRIYVKSPEVDNMAIHEKTGLSEESINILDKKNYNALVLYKLEGEFYNQLTNNERQLQDIEKMGGQDIKIAVQNNFVKTVDILIKNTGIIDDISKFLFSDFISVDKSGDNEESYFRVKQKGQDAISFIETSEINTAYLLKAQAKLLNLKEELKKEVE